jgi:hypothetical protein
MNFDRLSPSLSPFLIYELVSIQKGHRGFRAGIQRYPSAFQHLQILLTLKKATLAVKRMTLTLKKTALTVEKTTLSAKRTALTVEHGVPAIKHGPPALARTPATDEHFLLVLKQRHPAPIGTPQANAQLGRARVWSTAFRRNIYIGLFPPKGGTPKPKIRAPRTTSASHRHEARLFTSAAGAFTH